MNTFLKQHLSWHKARIDCLASIITGISQIVVANKLAIAVLAKIILFTIVLNRPLAKLVFLNQKLS